MKVPQTFPSKYKSLIISNFKSFAKLIFKFEKSQTIKQSNNSVKKLLL